MALRLAEDPFYPEPVVLHLVEQHERHVQLLLVEHLESGIGVAPQLALIHEDVDLAQPVREEDPQALGLLLLLGPLGRFLAA